MFDTHAHVNFTAFKEDAEAVIKRALEKNIAMILVGSQLSTSRAAIELAEKFPKVYAAVGLHPIQLQEMDVAEGGVVFKTRKEEFNYKSYRDLAEKDKVVAIGETGLDYFHVNTNVDLAAAIAEQKQVFSSHIDLANELELPVIIHTRGNATEPDQAYIDILSELKKNMPKKKGVLHCYGGPVSLVSQFIDLGFYISFNGILTFDRTGRMEQILLATPNDRILAETDCPYLTPEPFRGKRNEPSYIPYIIQKMAKIKNIDVSVAEKLTKMNAERLFHVAV